MRKHTLEVGEIRLLVELRGLKPESVDDVVDLGGRIIELLRSLLGRGVGTDICATATPSVSTFCPARAKFG